MYGCVGFPLISISGDLMSHQALWCFTTEKRQCKVAHKRQTDLNTHILGAWFLVALRPKLEIRLIGKKNPDLV